MTLSKRLRQGRAPSEAWNRFHLENGPGRKPAIPGMDNALTNGRMIIEVAYIAAKLAREGWTPPDPLLQEAREIAANHCYDPEGATKTREGQYDTHHPVKIALAALHRGAELAKAP